MAVMETKTAGGELATKFLVFRLDGQEFGVPVIKVQEIVQWLEVTRVPRMPAFVRGVVNLRSRVVPVIDLRQRFGLTPEPPTPRTCIVVLQVPRETGPMVAGAVVDEVVEMLDLAPESIAPPPEMGAGTELAFIAGIGQVAHRMIMVLNVEKILDNREWTAMEKVSTVGREQSHE